MYKNFRRRNLKTKYPLRGPGSECRAVRSYRQRPNIEKTRARSAEGKYNTAAWTKIGKYGRSATIGPTALFPLGRKPCYGFLSPFKIHCLRPDLNQRIFGIMASTITTRTRKTNQCILSYTELSNTVTSKCL